MSRTGPLIYCIIPADLADELHEQLRDFYREEPSVVVVVEHRCRDRRAPADRRRGHREDSEPERRRLRARPGRRVEPRRAALKSAEAPPLPPSAERYRGRLRFVVRDEPTTLQREDADTARLVVRIQGGEKDLVGPLYLRYFDRVYAYLKITLQDSHEAEDAAQAVFMRVLEALPTYERREVPFRAWLFRIVRNDAINRLRHRHRLTVESPTELAARDELATDATDAPDSVDWIGDARLLSLVEHLPLGQRQVIVLRYMMDFNTVEIAELLERSPEAIRQLHQRAMRHLRQRLSPDGESGFRRSQRKAATRMPRYSPVINARKRAAAIG